jgi:nitrogen fixation/metabolism regulation signal transduction histidine kinase
MGVRRLIRPIEQLIDAAQEVAAGNFGHKISARTGDEIEELAVQFNRMSAELQESYKRHWGHGQCLAGLIGHPRPGVE